MPLPNQPFLSAFLPGWLLVILVHFAFGIDFVVELQVVEQELPKSRLRLTLTIEPSFHQECYDSVLDEVRKSVKVKGFRDAKKAPLQLLMSAAGGEETVKGRVIEEVVEKALGVVSTGIIFAPGVEFIP